VDLAALAAAAVAAAGPVEISNKFIGCVKWQKYQINHRKCLFL
jgi:hypothetical protein